MDEKLADYGTTNEVAITLIDENGKEKTFKLPNAKDSSEIQAYAPVFASTALDSDTSFIGIDGNYPVEIKIDLIETTRTNVYNSQG